MAEKEEMTQSQYEQQDAVDVACYELILALAGKDETEIEWDIELIHKVEEAVEEVICDDLKLMSHMDFYPWIKKCEGCDYCEPFEGSNEGICRVDGGSDDAQCKSVDSDALGCDRWKDEKGAWVKS